MDGFLPKKQIQIWILEDKEKLDFTDSSLLLFPRRVAVSQIRFWIFVELSLVTTLIQP